MHIWQFVIDRGHGRIGNQTWCTGAAAGSLIETDLIDTLYCHLISELIRLGTRHRILETRHGTGMTTAERVASCFAGEVLISLHFDQLLCKRQAGRVYVTKDNQDMKECATLLSDTIAEWGSQTTERYTGCKVIDNSAFELVCAAEPAMILSPFAVANPDALILSGRLAQLARALAWQLTRWARAQNPGVCRFAPDGAPAPAPRPMIGKEDQFYR